MITEDNPQFRAEVEKALARRKLDLFRAYPKQQDVFAATAKPGIREVGVVAANQVGKSYLACAFTAIITTGQYPSWWVGRRWDGPIEGWVAGTTSQTTRDTVQKLLLGNPNELGTGLIPGRSIVDIKKSPHGVPDSIETVTIRHEPTGRYSRLAFKSFDQGVDRWSGATLDYIHADEEIPEDVHSEALTRLNVRSGLLLMTFTPLKGLSAVVTRLTQTRPEGSIVINMGIADAEHYTAEQRRIIIAGYPDHERDARAYGRPVLGSGAVFPIPEEWIVESPIEIPAWWPRICGLDIGWDHPTAAVWIAWDKDSDIVHIYDTYRVKEQTAVVHAAAIKARGPWIPVAFPFDALSHDKGAGKIIAAQYREQGVRMMKEHATHPPEQGKKEGTGGVSTEAGILEMLMRFQTGRLKVAFHLADWLGEYRNYYRKDGLLIKKNDDLMSATRISLMMLRHATIKVVRPDLPPMPGYRASDSGLGTLG